MAKRPIANGKGKTIGRRDLAQALENVMFSLALYAAGKGSVAESFLQTELDKMSKMVLDSVSPQGRLQLESALAALLKIEAAKLEAPGGDA